MYKNYVKKRDELGLTDYAVAVGSGIGQNVFYSWINRVRTENPKAALSFENAAKLARFFHVPMEFFTAEDTETDN